MKRFAFIIHPITAADVTRKFPWMGYFSESAIEMATRYMPPVKASYIEGVRSPYAVVDGFFIACPLTSKQMVTLPEDYVLGRIEKACQKAVKMGAEIIGLGAMTSVVGEGGLRLAQRLPVPVTTGNSYTVAIAVEGLYEAMKLMDRTIEDSKAVVVGATGSIGAICSRLLAKNVKELTLLARKTEPLYRLRYRILNESGLAVTVTTSMKEALRDADLIVTVSSAADAIIEPAYLKSGAVVCDVARPRDVAKAVAHERPDVLVIDGGVVEVPSTVDFRFNFGFPPGLSYACMAETMILALEDRRESFSLGRELSLEKVEEISLLAQKHGFSLAGLRSFDRPLTEIDIMKVKQTMSSHQKMLQKGNNVLVDNILQPRYNTKLKMVD
ncbi:shikimate dehydrogenase [Heliorestis convoluta]|uniref:Semialdehyde dehydrogenase, NAD binding domain protein n=1 Tax=Heliorestis convoluta TaxID=356322 RepID=A0A5Q2N573_9FIRM|nr:shikimate dehydrogenase [Heliorestis convoluta]QGG48776.1 semialdehyde dehydrogenase, NAD binding domain protein [Heliorestis convoluta]